MFCWSKVIEEYWDDITFAMNLAAYKVGKSSGEKIIRVELHKTGAVDMYWTFDSILSDHVRNGAAIIIKDYYGGECWSKDWADSYDADADLDDILRSIRENEKA